MAMTNEEIIRTTKALLGITEESHTYNRWRSMGYQVRKGEKAAFKATIWKHGKKKVETEDGEEKDAGRMFMKTASFFKASQVEAVTA